MYHVSGDGNVRRCRAQHRCPLDSEHFEVEAEARIYGEQRLEAEFTTLPATRTRSSTLPYSTPAAIIYPEEGEQEFWDLLRNNIGTIDFNGNEFAVQPDDGESSSVYCISCARPLSLTNSYFVQRSGSHCDKCGDRTGSIFDTSALLARSSLKYLNDEEVRKARWFHTTQRSGWVESLNDPNREFIHLGTEASAQARTATLLNDQDCPTLMYELALNPDLDIHPSMTFEDPYQDDPVNVSDPPAERNRIAFHGVTRYVNELEDPGSISLLANPRSFRVVGVKIIQASKRA